MRSLRTSGLRTQLAFVTAFLVVFSLGVTVAHWLQSESQSQAVLALHADLAVATKLPRLKSLLHQQDLVTSQYLLTGDPRLIPQHAVLLAQVRNTQTDLNHLLPAPQEQAVLKDLNRQLRAHFVQERRWIVERRASRLNRVQVERLLTSRRVYEDSLEIAASMHDVKIEEFPARLEAQRRATARAHLLILLAGVLASALLAVLLSIYIVNPVRALSDYAQNWKAGQPWTLQAPSVSPEINALAERMKSLIENLNREYIKERDLGRLKTSLVSTVSHELNNALSVIHAATATLEEIDHGGKEPRREKMYRILKAQALSLSGTVANLLNLGRLESGKLALDRKKTDIAAVLKSCADLLGILADNKKLRLSLSLPEAPIALDADPDSLTLVVTNLLGNAIKYTPEGGSIEIGLSTDAAAPGMARVFVKDTGIGVAPEEKERIFSGYYRTPKSREAAKGFGVGLALAKTIIDAHGGRLELDSEPGRGSTFSFDLPLWKEKA